MIYENGEMTSTGIEQLEINSGDVFELKEECWKSVELYGSYDSYDILVDKAIYNYYENVLPKKFKSLTAPESNTFWDEMAMYKIFNSIDNAGNPKYLSALDYLEFGGEYIDYLTNMDVSSLSGNDLFKYYYSLRLHSDDFNNLKTQYQSYLSTLTTYPAFGEFSIPFHTGAAKSLGLDLDDAIKNTTDRADTTYGPEGLAWELAGLACYNTLTKADLSGLTIDALNNEYVSSKDVALSTYMLAYAASNVSFRELKDSNGVDAIKYLFDNFYDLNTMKFDTEKLSNDMSSNQIYAALVAYKLQRDLGYAQNLFE